MLTPIPVSSVAFIHIHASHLRYIIGIARQLDGVLERCTAVRHLQFGFQATLAWVVAALASAPADLATFKAEELLGRRRRGRLGGA